MNVVAYCKLDVGNRQIVVGRSRIILSEVTEYRANVITVLSVILQVSVSVQRVSIGKGVVIAVLPNNIACCKLFLFDVYIAVQYCVVLNQSLVICVCVCEQYADVALAYFRKSDRFAVRQGHIRPSGTSVYCFVGGMLISSLNISAAYQYVALDTHKVVRAVFDVVA